MGFWTSCAEEGSDHVRDFFSMLIFMNFRALFPSLELRQNQRVGEIRPLLWRENK